jgi:hypothetical protein
MTEYVFKLLVWPLSGGEREEFYAVQADGIAEAKGDLFAATDQDENYWEWKILEVFEPTEKEWQVAR